MNNNINLSDFNFIFNGEYYYIFYKEKDVTNNQELADLLNIDKSILCNALAKHNTIQIKENYYFRDVKTNKNIIDKIIFYLKKQEKNLSNDINNKVIDKDLENYSDIAKKLLTAKLLQSLNYDIPSINLNENLSKLDKDKLNQELENLKNISIPEIINNISKSLK